MYQCPGDTWQRVKTGKFLNAVFHREKSPNKLHTKAHKPQWLGVSSHQPWKPEMETRAVPLNANPEFYTKKQYRTINIFVD